MIQVIGAMSNRSEPHRKFVQTFNLAPQNNGYYVLNDIFRYLLDEEEETGSGDASQEMTQITAVPVGYQEPVPTVEETESKGLTSSSDPEAQEHDAMLVDTELEEIIREQESEAKEAVPTVNGTPSVEQADVVKEAPVAVTSKTETSDDGTQTEQLKDPEPSPAPQPQEPAKPAAAVKPPVPRTWAQLASSNRPSATSATVPVAMPSPTIQAKPSQSPQVLTPIAPAAAAVVTPTTPVREPSPAEGSQEGSSGGWQTAGAEHSRKQSRSQAQPPPNDGRVRAYVKNVYPEVGSEELKAALSKHGDIVYFDISRPKVCYSPLLTNPKLIKILYRIAHSSNLPLELAFKPPLLPTLTRSPTTTSSSKNVGSINTRTSVATYAATVTASMAELARPVVLLLKKPAVVALLLVPGVAPPPLVAAVPPRSLPRALRPAYVLRFQPYTLPEPFHQRHTYDDDSFEHTLSHDWHRQKSSVRGKKVKLTFCF